MCSTHSDCDIGERCGENICWGNPPAARFAAELLPPANGGDLLAVTEIPELRIGSDGAVSGLAFAPSVTITGRIVLACPDNPPADRVCGPEESVAAEIIARRVSDIPGRRFYTRQATSRAGQGPGEASFTLTLPRRDPGDDTYEITILPSAAPSAGEANSDTVSAAELAAPRVFEYAVSVATTAGDDPDHVVVEWTLGEPADHMSLSGRVESAVGTGMGNMQVAAYAQELQNRRVSSLSYTDEQGNFVLSLPAAMSDEKLTVVVEPVGEVHAPTLRRTFTD
ncbi:MAG: hypothetical protein AAGC55_14390, partial [Myxococcota bacterium]